MKIGLVLDDTLDTPDGVQQYVLSVGAWLASKGHDVHYLVGHTIRNDISNLHSMSRNLQVKFNGNRMSMPLPTSKRRLRRFLAEEQFDVIHVQVPYSPFMAGRLLKVMPSSTAVIGTFHILPYSRLVAFANRLLGLMNQRSGRRFDQMIAVSEPAADFARRTYGYEPVIVPNAVRLKQFQAATSDSPKLNIVFLGRLVARKGSLLLLQAIHELQNRQQLTENVRVIIGGKGELLLKLHRYSEQCGLQDIVSFAGFVNEDDKPSFLARADIAVFPSVAGESFGISLLEAMAASRGVVLAGDNPGYASVMQPYPDQLFNPRDIGVFADKLAYYLSDAQARASAMSAQRKYVKRFDVGTVGKKLLKIYDEALQTRAQS